MEASIPYNNHLQTLNKNYYKPPVMVIIISGIKSEKMKYYIDIRRGELYKLTDVLPDNAIEFKPVLKRCRTLLILTRNPFKNVKLYFNNELNLLIQSKEWLKVCKILKHELDIGLKAAKELMDKKIRNKKGGYNYS